MGKMVRAGWLVVAGVSVGFASSSASAAPNYTMDLLSGGANEVTLDPGQRLSVDVILSTTDDSTQTEGALLLVSFDQEGILLTSWDWAAPPFISGGNNDFTRMAPAPADSGGTLLGSLPLPITSAYGIRFDASSDPEGVFGVGTVLSFGLELPATRAEPYDAELNLTLGAFNEFQTIFDEWNGMPAGPLTIHVTPEPATLMLLGIGGLAVLRRRKA